MHVPAHVCNVCMFIHMHVWDVHAYVYMYVYVHACAHVYMRNSVPEAVPKSAGGLNLALHAVCLAFSSMPSLYLQAKKELEVLQARPMPELPDYGSGSAGAPKHYAMHVSVGLAAMCAWWYYLQDVPSLERKLLSVLLFPVSNPCL